MNELSLFSGIGGGILGTKYFLGWRTVGYVEIEEYCQKVIRQRIKDGLLDEAPIFGDIRTFNSSGYAEAYQGMVDVITAGFPCQPFSIAGKSKGEMDERNMWPDTIKTIRIVQPRFVFLENVPALLTHEYYGTILGDLSESGYNARWKIISATEVGAPHKRDRLWIIANSDGERVIQSMEDGGISCNRPDNSRIWSEDWNLFISAPGQVAPSKWFSPRSKIDPRSLFIRDNNGISYGVDRLKACGNAQLPQLAASAWDILTGEK